MYQRQLGASAMATVVSALIPHPATMRVLRPPRSAHIPSGMYSRVTISLLRLSFRPICSGEAPSMAMYSGWS